MRKFSGETGWQLGSLGREGFALRKESSASTCLCYICYISSVNVALLNIFAYLFLWSLCFSSSSTWNILTSHPKRQESKRASKCSSGLLLDSDQSEGPQVWQKVSPTTCLYGWTIEYEWTVASEEPLHSFPSLDVCKLQHAKQGQKQNGWLQSERTGSAHLHTDGLLSPPPKNMFRCDPSQSH